MSDRKLQDESARLAAVHRYEILDTPREAPFDRIANLVRAVLNVPIATISLIDANRQWLKSCVGLDIIDTPRDISFCTHTIQAREPMIIPDARLDPRFVNNPLVVEPPHIVSYLGVPLSTPDGYNVGALCAIDRVPRDFNASQIEVMKSFAALVTDEMELRRLAQTDSLTGVATRRGFCLEAEKSIARFVRSRTPSAMIVLDIDHFKHVNDTWGHPAGDAVLRAVCGVLEQTIRKSDIIGRLGGEEFGALLAGASLEEAIATAERLRLAVEAMTVQHGAPIRITSSFGVAALTSASLAPDEWMAKADAALYEAKHAGRNRCCVAEEAASLVGHY